MRRRKVYYKKPKPSYKKFAPKRKYGNRRVKLNNARRQRVGYRL